MWAAEAILKKDVNFGKQKKHCINKEIHPIAKIGDKVTITKGIKYKYAIWHHRGIMDLPKKYIDEKTINIISKN